MRNLKTEFENPCTVIIWPDGQILRLYITNLSERWQLFKLYDKYNIQPWMMNQ